MNATFSTEVDVLLDEKVLTKENKESHLVLFNDDVNTFEWVIECLVRYCHHDVIQAEQCAHIVHFNGKCSIKKGDFMKLKPICEALLEKGLSVELN